MKYIKNTKRPGTVQFLVGEDISSNKFRSLMEELASKLKSKIEWFSMPEAEIGKIKLSTGEICAKLDFVYGVALDCHGFVDHEISKIEAVLSKK